MRILKIQRFVFWGLLIGFLLPSCTRPPISEEGEKPNVVIIYVDDLGYGDLSSYGGEIPTPKIDQIGKEGIRFTDFYVSAPACTPSRYSLLTGSYPQRSIHGLENVLMPGEDYHFDKDEVLLPELMKSQGYSTAIIGKWHLGGKEPSYLPSNHGFDTFTGFESGCIDYFCHVYGSMKEDWIVDGKSVQEDGYSTDLLTDHALDFIDQTKRKQHPFFLYLSYNAPHYGKTDPAKIPEGTLSMKQGNYEGNPMMNTLQAPQNYIEQFSDMDNEYRQVYAAMVASLDENVGRLLDKLAADNILENTIVWFISDNGGYSESYHGHASNGPLRGEKATLWEGGIRIPAMVLWKAKIEGGQTRNQPLANIDLLPTLGNIIGFKDTLSQISVDGMDISDVLFENEKVQRDLFWKFREFNAFRRGDWKLVNGEYLFNLRNDIGEQEDLSKQNPEKLKELQHAFQETDASIKPYRNGHLSQE